MDPWEVVKWIAIFRLILPDALFRLCGGRVENLGELQATAVKAGLNGVMMGNFLTTLGNTPDEDREMFEDLGLNVARQEDNGSNPRPDNRSGWLEGETPDLVGAALSEPDDAGLGRAGGQAVGSVDAAALRGQALGAPASRRGEQRRRPAARRARPPHAAPTPPDAGTVARPEPVGRPPRESNRCRAGLGLACDFVVVSSQRRRRARTAGLARDLRGDRVPWPPAASGAPAPAPPAGQQWAR